MPPATIIRTQVLIASFKTPLLCWKRRLFDAAGQADNALRASVSHMHTEVVRQHNLPLTTCINYLEAYTYL